MQLSPGNAEYLSCLSKQWSDLVFIPGTSDEDARTYSRTAIRLAEQARTCCLLSPCSWVTSVHLNTRIIVTSYGMPDQNMRENVWNT